MYKIYILQWCPLWVWLVFIHESFNRRTIIVNTIDARVNGTPSSFPLSICLQSRCTRPAWFIFPDDILPVSSYALIPTWMIEESPFWEFEAFDAKESLEYRVWDDSLSLLTEGLSGQVLSEESSAIHSIFWFNRPTFCLCINNDIPYVER